LKRSEIERAARALCDSRYVISLTGAGLSVESGIPPFRGPGGIWTRYGDPPMDGYERFLRDPGAEWRLMLNPERPMKNFSETLAHARPHEGHRALAALEKLGVLRCLITQNIDNLHIAAGHREVIEIHGNATLLRCTECNKRWRFLDFEIDLDALPPHCDACNGVVKSDTVNFGEPIPTDVLERCMEEGRIADCCLVVGTSATVYPAAQIPLDVLHRDGRLIEVNLFESEITPACSISLRGEAGVTLTALYDAVHSKLTQ